MRVVIVEDEGLAAERLAGMIRQTEPEAEICAILTSVEEAAAYFRANRPELVFMDIQLSDGLCFEIFEHVQLTSPVIFTTAYDQYSIRAFKLNSIDYLLKPVRLEDLKESLEKFKSLRSSYLPDLDEMLRMIRNRESSYKKRFLVQYGQKIKKVETEEIAYFYAADKTVFLTTHSNARYLIDHSLDRLQEMLDPERFFRINRKLLISCEAIKNMVPYSRSRIKIDLNPPISDELDAIVSVERSSGFKEWLDR